MGTSYETLLVVGDLTPVRENLAAAGVDGLVLPAADGRVAVVPREVDYGYADTAALAQMISRRYGFAALSNEVADSDVVFLRAYRDGELSYRYVSDQSMLVDWFIDDGGRSRFRLDGVEYPAAAPSPTGPLGTDPHGLAPFGVGEIDLDRLAAALRGGDVDDRVEAEAQHWTILEALNLDPRALTTAFRHARPDTLPNAMPISANHNHPPGV
jgi:hypothetical protein